MEFPRTELLPRHTTGDSVGSRARPRRVQKPVVSDTSRTRRGNAIRQTRTFRRHGFLRPRRITATTKFGSSRIEKERNDDFSTTASC